MTAQIVLIILIAMELGYQLAMNGKPHKHDHEFWSSFLSWLFVASIMGRGGFWDVFFN